MSSIVNTSNVPKWLEAQLFENILKENVPNYKAIKEFKAYAAVPAGENFSTVITRVEIHIELQGKSVREEFWNYFSKKIIIGGRSIQKRFL